jgi:hypothetical protein
LPIFGEKNWRISLNKNNATVQFLLTQLVKNAKFFSPNFFGVIILTRAGICPVDKQSL